MKYRGAEKCLEKFPLHSSYPMGHKMIIYDSESSPFNHPLPFQILFINAEILINYGTILQHNKEWKKSWWLTEGNGK